MAFLDVGVLGRTPVALLDVLRQALRDRGWTEGQNLTIDYRFAETRDRRDEVVAQILDARPDVIVAPAAAAFVIAPRLSRPEAVAGGRSPITSVPLVFVAVSDPVGAGMVQSLARPGGTITGITYLGVELNTKRLELLKEALPSLARVGVLVPADHPLRDRMVREIEAAAGALRLTLHVVEVPATAPADRIDVAFAALAAARAEAILGLQGAHFFRERERVCALALRHRLPGIFEISPYVDAGCLLAYAPNLEAIYRSAATLVDKILRGARPADLPVEQPTIFELALNRKTARTLGVTLPPALLLRVDRTVE